MSYGSEAQDEVVANVVKTEELLHLIIQGVGQTTAVATLDCSKDRTNYLAQEWSGLLVEFAVLPLQIQLVVQKVQKDLADRVTLGLEWWPDIEQDVVNVGDHIFPQHVYNDIINKTLNHWGATRDLIQHYTVLIVASGGAEGCLSFIPLTNVHLVFNTVEM